jgi:hypothetical protein
VKPRRGAHPKAERPNFERTPEQQEAHERANQDPRHRKHRHRRAASFARQAHSARSFASLRAARIEDRHVKAGNTRRELETRPAWTLLDATWWIPLFTDLWAWLRYFIPAKLPDDRKHATRGVYTMPETCRIGLAADWGSDTDSSVRVAEQMRAQENDINIHLGDVYFVGDPAEYDRIFIGETPGNEGSWPRGTHEPRPDATALGAYAMCGNHEMMAGGYGIYERTMPHLGQDTSYFVLENSHWRVVALDTGYTAWRNPITIGLFEHVLKKFKLFRGLNHAHMRWLREVAFKDANDPRPVILLSHHQPISAYELDYPRIASQLRPWMNRCPLWFWGHEHRFTMYGTADVLGQRVRGRCIGHGGMPEAPDFTPTIAEWAKSVVVTPKQGRGVPDESGQTYAMCGWCTIAFDGPTLRVEYWEEDPVQHHPPYQAPPRPLLTETWTIGADGAVSGTASGLDTDAYQLMPGRSLDELVR